MAHLKTSTKRAEAKATKASKAPKTVESQEQKHPGIVAAIIEVLRKGPISKADILAQLVKKFPDRPARGMRRTIHCQLPKRLIEEKKLAVKQDAQGRFFIRG